MTILEEVKGKWSSQTYMVDIKKYDQITMRRLVNYRVKKHNKKALKYFWKSILLQALVNTLLGYVLVTNSFDPVIFLIGTVTILLYISFSVRLFKKAHAISEGKKFEDDFQDSFLEYVTYSHEALNRFFNFKKLSDIILTPLSCVTGVFLTFHLFIPGGIYDWPELAALTLTITLISCLKAIVDENNKNFEQPLEQMKLLLNEFNNDQI